ncbi:ADPRase [Catopsilia pomona nucleopolyhedrovirus]|uniref:ADPRase n=1 Tax=Catopsilia pomona nucleopolyhedrovirus TaxID=1850906 RepID=A0A172WZH5_9ABAC|nr:ADPRase [Catopsilia pomona nucleopolyhedrovirus]ANF29748.1 ADPRase [Catopsilia pomona nucleopolyhedrovirus]
MFFKCPLCKMRNAAGLFMITEADKAVLLCARRAYRNVYTSCAPPAATAATANIINNNGTFLEKISIPRGHRDCCDGKVYETAVREFIEETGRFFNSAFIYKLPFTLQWRDDGVLYKYLIYVGVVRGNLHDLNAKPNTYTVKLLPGPFGNDYQIVLKPRRFNCEISRSLTIVPLKKYFNYMNDKQLVTYDFSNYIKFFDFVRMVKNKFDKKCLHNFFYATLKKIDDKNEHKQSQQQQSRQDKQRRQQQRYCQ